MGDWRNGDRMTGLLLLLLQRNGDKMTLDRLDQQLEKWGGFSLGLIFARLNEAKHKGGFNCKLPQNSMHHVTHPQISPRHPQLMEPTGHHQPQPPPHYHHGHTRCCRK